MKTERGQAMAEVALMIPIMTLLIFGLVFAGFYAFRATAADWGVFITGVAEGVYNDSATHLVRETILWPDIRDAVTPINYEYYIQEAEKLTLEMR